MTGKRKRARKRREPGTLSKVLAVLYEDAKRRRALRILERQSWSLDFLAAALVKAGKGLGENLVLVITSKDGNRLELSYDRAKESRLAQEIDTSVFMHLDDDLAVERFIRENSRR